MSCFDLFIFGKKMPTLLLDDKLWKMFTVKTNFLYVITNQNVADKKKKN